MDNIRLKKIRNIEESGTIKLKPLTIFVGKNGMGKSSLMRLFPLIKQSVAVSKKDHCFGIVRKVLTLVILGQ